MTVVRASAQNIDMRRSCTWCVFAWLCVRGRHADLWNHDRLHSRLREAHDEGSGIRSSTEPKQRASEGRVLISMMRAASMEANMR